MKPHIIRGGSIRELADTYKNPLGVYREWPSNVYDQSNHPEAQGRFPSVWIYIQKSRKRVWIIDDMTGIPNKDMEDFLAVGTETTSRSSGKTVGLEISSREHINPKVIGQKHVGKLSCLFASETGDVEFYSNNGKNGHYLHMNYDGWYDFNDLYFDIMDTTSALSHVGLKMIINDVKKECLNIRSVEKAISKWFGILLSKKKIRIRIIDVDNNNKEIDVQKPEELDTKGEISIPMPNGNVMKVNLTETETPVFGYTLDIYQKEVYVRSIPFPTHMVTGYVNYDGLELNTPREDYKDDSEFHEILGEYIAMHFPRNYVPKPNKEMGKKEKDHIQQVTEEVCTAISQVDPKLLPEIFGYATPFGIQGTELKTPGRTKEDNNNWETKENMQYTDDPDAETGTCAGNGTCGGTCGTHAQGVKEGGEYTVKIRKQPPKDPDSPTLVMPDIDIVDIEGRELPTLSARVIEVEKKLEIVINIDKPASTIFRKSGNLERYRDTLYDRLIAAIIRLKYVTNDLDGFEKKRDEILNVLYQGNIIQKQTEQMSVTSAIGKRK